MAALASITPAPELFKRESNACFSFNAAGGGVGSFTCNPGTPCLQSTTVAEAFVYCSGASPLTECFDHDETPETKCNANELCCTGVSSCATWSINEGSLTQLICASSSYDAQGWNQAFIGFTATPSVTNTVGTQISLPSSKSTSSSSSGSDVGAAIGVIVGAVAFVALVIGLFWYLCCMRRQTSWWNTRKRRKYKPLPEPHSTAAVPAYAQDDRLSIATGAGYSASGYQASLYSSPVYQNTSYSNSTYQNPSYQMGPIVAPPPETPQSGSHMPSTAQWQSSDPGRVLTYRVEYIPGNFNRDDVRNRLFSLSDRIRVTVRSLAPSTGTRGQGTQTATVEFQSWNKKSQGPSLSSEAEDLGIHVDKGFQGWTPMNRPADLIAADVVAVTGLAGHAFGSWSVDHQAMWIRDFLPRDIPNIRVMTYGYNSQLTETASRQDFDQHAEDFAAGLEVLWESNYFQRPTIFIGHSLGCLIIKKALILSKGWKGRPDKLEDIVPLCIFLGAPHNGLATDALMTLVKGKASESLIDELKPGSPTLKNLKFKFDDVAQNIRVLSIFERRETKTAIEKNGMWVREGAPVMMVEKQNAVTYLPLETRVSSDTDHRDLSRLRHTDGGSYGAIKRAISNALNIHVERSMGFTSFPEEYE